MLADARHVGLDKYDLLMEDRKENIFVGFALIVLARSYAGFHP
jgi:hypothetical protein